MRESLVTVRTTVRYKTRSHRIEGENAPPVLWLYYEKGFCRYFSPDILQTPLKRAFGSISSVWANISPLMTAVAFRTSLALTCMEPSTSPNISAFVETMFPVTFPFGPITILPLQLTSPSIFPSRRKSVSVTMSPLTVVPAARVLCRPPFVFSSFYFIPIIYVVSCLSQI